MESIDTIIEFLRGQPVIVLFALIGCGCALGRIRVVGIALGSIAGTLLIALIVGRYGFSISGGAQAIGFALFIFSVGYQAGPKFIEVLKSQGLKYLALALFVAAVAFLFSWGAGILLHLPTGGNAGLLAGALTSTPTLAAAQSAVSSGLVPLPPGLSPQAANASIASSYAITYLVGTLGIIAVVSVLPRILGLDLAGDARRHAATNKQQAPEPLQARAYRVTNEAYCARPIAELALQIWDHFSAVWIRRDGVWIKPAADEQLRLGDEIHAYGNAQFFRAGIEQAGPEIRFLKETETAVTWTRVSVAKSAAIGRPLQELKLAGQHGIVVYAISREGHMLPVEANLELARGDILTVAGPELAIKKLPSWIGPLEANAVETGMTSLSFGISCGAALGLLSMSVYGVPLSLGMAGGLLVIGALVGWINNARPSVGRLPDAARWVLMEFGLLVFIAGVGLSAGASITETFRQAGPSLLLAAVVVVLAPIGLGYAFGRLVLRLEPLVLMGALTGAMTSGPALSLVTQQADSPLPVLGYTGTYAFASIALTVAGTLIMYL